uniref:Uncharacterized protein n=1 Tax=Arundo donax TaxID=35708 RepID=A0A0A8ZS56_ARUDO
MMHFLMKYRDDHKVNSSRCEHH